MSGLIDALKSRLSNLASFQALLDSGKFDLDFQEPETGNTALLTSLQFKKEYAALEIIRRGANVELANAEGGTPLMMACIQNLKFAAQEIARRVTDLEVVAESSGTALSYAAYFSSPEIIKMLVRRGAHVTTKSAFGRTVLHQALMGGRLTNAEYFLADYDCFSIHDCDTEAKQALHMVCETGQTKAAQSLSG
jgi:ankyrin repeat protein